MGTERRVVLIAGPTASGKSALAIEKARVLGGVIVNADSMQVYDVLDVLTARPDAGQLAAAEHKLYGFVPPSERFSTGAWLSEVRKLMADEETRPLVFAGGTGLYFDALINGIAEVPEVPETFVRAAEAELEGLGRAERGEALRVRDPEMAERIKEPDRQRVVRALSVLAATGKSLAYWQDREAEGLLGGCAVERVVLDPDRDLLRERIANRFRQMLDGGAIGEALAIDALGLDPTLPAMKAIGVREIIDWQSGRIDRASAEERGIVATRQYAKRQRTWLRNRMGDWPRAGN